MPNGDREDWKNLLPVISAFVAGKKVQRRDHDGRWKDVDQLHSLLSSYYPHRVRPDPYRAVPGTWSRKYREKVPGSVGSVFYEGAVIYSDLDDDSIPDWPQRTYIEEGKFTPKDRK